MKRMYLAALTLAGVLLGQATAFADEGMWLIQDINAALEKKMQERGLKLSAGEIYNADAPGAAVSDAIVSLGFYCTGSIISDQGLLITNHHCAYSDVFALSTPEHNYLEEGYWAVRSDQELPIPDKQVFFLKRVLDITGEVKNLRDDLAKKGLPCGMRRVSHILESKYKKDTGKEAYLNSMWADRQCRSKIIKSMLLCKCCTFIQTKLITGIAPDSTFRFLFHSFCHFKKPFALMFFQI